MANVTKSRTTAQRNELLREQNYLLCKQNDLIREQNNLLREQNKFSQAATSNNVGERKIFIENIDRDEIRDGFLITSHRKKLWNVQINLLKEFARICQKYNLRWFATYGTLLGAVRHKGFIPWDFDVDVAMFRPEYEKFKQIAATEVKEPYFADVWYDYLLESEGATLDNGSVQFITKAQEKSRPVPWFTQWPSIRLRDSRTTMIETPDRNFINQGIWIDIFPLDSLPPFDNENSTINFNIGRVLLLSAAVPAQIRQSMQNKRNLLISYDELEKILSKPYSERGKIFDNFMNENFSMSERVGDIRDYCLTNNQKFYFANDFRDVVHLPFETIELSAPVGYDSVLTSAFKDWRKPVIDKPHFTFCSADISYKEYFQKTKAYTSARAAEFF